MSDSKSTLLQDGFKTTWENNNTELPIQEEFYSMRGWQKEAFERLKDDHHIILNAPMGSGKSFMMCFLTEYKIKQNPSLRAIIAVPQVIIASGFVSEKLQLPDGEQTHWNPRHNLCSEKSSRGTVRYLINWLEKPSYESRNDQVLICTHATLVKTFTQLDVEGRLHLLKNLLLWIDEAHHVKNVLVDDDEDIVIGNGLGIFYIWMKVELELDSPLPHFSEEIDTLSSLHQWSPYLKDITCLMMNILKQ